MKTKNIISILTGLLYLALITPLVVALSSFIFPFVAPKIFYFRIVVELAFITYLYLVYKDKKYIYSTEPYRNQQKVSSSI